MTSDDCIEGMGFFPELPQQRLFLALVGQYPEQIIATHYRCHGNLQVLQLTINLHQPQARRVFLHYHPQIFGDHIVARAESTRTVTTPRLFLALQLSRWDERPVYTAALNDEMRLVLGCSRRMEAMTAPEDFFELTLGLAEALDHIEEVWKHRQIFSGLWCHHHPGDPDD
ncbi:MAG: hypothetical protein PHQ27_08450 [Victivallales bacterium]|nr:hypothetical protein [Victivallales bacterium]